MSIGEIWEFLWYTIRNVNESSDDVLLIRNTRETSGISRFGATNWGRHVKWDSKRAYTASLNNT